MYEKEATKDIEAEKVKYAKLFEDDKSMTDKKSCFNLLY
jgi:hypothetical protein